jgi:hypothetical protein
MKGRISPQLEKVLNDPRGREELKNHLLGGKDGRVHGGDKKYLLRIDVTKASDSPYRIKRG